MWYRQYFNLYVKRDIYFSDHSAYTSQLKIIINDHSNYPDLHIKQCINRIVIFYGNELYY